MEAKIIGTKFRRTDRQGDSNIPPTYCWYKKYNTCKWISFYQNIQFSSYDLRIIKILHSTSIIIRSRCSNQKNISIQQFALTKKSKFPTRSCNRGFFNYRHNPTQWWVCVFTPSSCFFASCWLLVFFIILKKIYRHWR